MTISCIIPTRDRSTMVCRAIDSVLAQDCVVDEIVVVDDVSVDDTAAVLAVRYPMVYVVHADGVGPGLARNVGVAAARNDILMFLDSDDVWLPHHAGQLMGVFARGYEVGYGTCRTQDQVQGGTFHIPEQGEAIEGDCLAALSRWCFLLPSAMGFTRPAFEKTGGFIAGGLGEDWSFFIRLAKHYHFGFSGYNPITERYLHEGSICNEAGRQRVLAGLALVDAALSDSQIEAESYAHFSNLMQWTKEQKRDWRTVQEWYLALKEEELV